MKFRFFQPVIAFTTICALNASATVLYVDVNSTNPVPPYAGWNTAATNIQNAIGAAASGDSVMVGDGVYGTGGTVVYGLLMTNRVAVTKRVIVQSLHGPQFSTIVGNLLSGNRNGDGAIRCVYLTNGAMLAGFTLTNGGTRASGDLYHENAGGGVWCQDSSGTVSNCVLVDNGAYYLGGGAYGCTLTNCLLNHNSSQSGGGTYSSVLNNCVLTNNQGGFGGGGGGGANNSSLSNCVLIQNDGGALGGGALSCTMTCCMLVSNSVSTAGGGAYNSVLNCCLLVGNSSLEGAGGAEDSLLVNCTVVNNDGGAFNCYVTNSVCYFNGDNGGSYGLWDHCCVSAGASGTGNITNAPLFVDYVANNFRLQASSPCINSAKNGAGLTAVDLDGNSRISGGTVDMGAYEFQNPTSVLSYAWAGQYGLPTDGSADFTDKDHDGMNNWQEWRAGTSPIDPLSTLKMLTVTNDASGTTVSWQSVVGVTYYLQRNTLNNQSGFSTIQGGVVGQSGITSFTDTMAPAPPLFYRVGVQ